MALRTTAPPILRDAIIPSLTMFKLLDLEIITNLEEEADFAPTEKPTKLFFPLRETTAFFLCTKTLSAFRSTST